VRITVEEPPCLHAWAYVPDLAGAFVRLANTRDKLGGFETFGFAGRGEAVVDDLLIGCGDAYRHDRHNPLAA